MSSREDILRALIAAGVIMLEWYAMQPYHSPVYAAFWRRLTRLFQGLAAFFGKLALQSEYNYYVAVGSGT